MSFAWRSTSPRCARSANKSFARLFKGGGVQGQRPCPRSAERGTLFLLHKAQEGVQGGTLAGGSPFSFLALGACAPIRWVVVDGLSCDSTPFLWCLPKETVSSRQRKALFLPWWLHHSRERFCLNYLYSSSPDLGRGLVGVGGLYGCAVFLGRSLFPQLPIPPHFFALAQRNGVEPQRNALLGAATAAVRSRPPLPRTRSPNITADCVKLT